MMFFLGDFADMYEVTDVKLNGRTLDKRTATNRDGWYLDDNVSCKIVFQHTFNTYLIDPYRDIYQITGKYGFVDHSNGNMRPDVWEIIREMVAVKSRFWVRTDKNGNEYIQDTYPEYTMQRIESLTRGLN